MTLKLIPQILILTLLSLLGLSACESMSQAKEAKGGCNKNDVKLAINSSNTKFPKIMDTCASDAWGNAAKTGACLKKKYPALSDSCTNCFGKMADCSASHCKFKCVSDHFSEKCLACVETNCRPSLIECTGLKADKLPPRK